MVNTLGAPLVPQIADAEGVPLDAAQWVYTLPPLVAVLATPLLGRLGDGARRDRMLLATIAITCAGCVVSAVAPSFGWLLAGRGLQGVGFAGLPLCVAVARVHVRDDARTRAIMLLSVAAGGGSAIGFPLTALIALRLDIHGAYWFGAAVTATALAGVLATVPRSHAPSRALPLDLPGAALLGVGLGALLLALSRAATWGAAAPQTLALALVGSLALVGWIALELRVAHPLIDLRLAAQPVLLVANLGGLSLMFGMYAGVSLMNRYAQAPLGQGLDASVLTAGIILAPMGATVVVSPPLTRILARRLGTPGVFPLGAAVAAGTYAVLAVTPAPSVAGLMLASALVGLAIGWTFAVIPALVVAHVPDDRTGSAMSLHQVLRSAGSAAGSAVSITVLTAFAAGAAGYTAGYAMAGLTCAVTALAAIVVLPRQASHDLRTTRARGRTSPASPTVTRMDLAAYLRHVGLPEQGWEPTVASLRRLHRAHVDAIPFANVSPALGRVPALDLPTLERRLVAERRGGYCLEHVMLFAAVLEALGFEAVQQRLCKVGDPAQVPAERPPTHLTVLARPADDERRWMADVGFGVGILGPIPLPPGPGEGEPVRHGRWEHRADVLEDGRILLMERDAEGWRPLHQTFDRDVGHAEIAEANRWVALQPGSPFARRLVAMRTTDEGRERLVGTRLEAATAGGEATVRELEPAEALEALGSRFGVQVDDADRAALARLLADPDAAAGPLSPLTRTAGEARPAQA